VRRPLDRERVQAFMRALGRAARGNARVYFTGGTTAVLLGWRDSTVDIDLRVVPEEDAVYRALPQLKEELQMNIELAAPSDFIPELPGWEGRSAFISQEGPLTFHHYDLYSQALAKIERGHARDVADVDALLAGGHIDRDQLLAFYEAIEPQLYRFPAVDPVTFRRAVEEKATRA
jgi:hypothetical protein